MIIADRAKRPEVWELETNEMSESSYECEECGKVIDEDDAWVEVDIPSDLNEAIGTTTAVVHPDCLEAYREKHPRDSQPLEG